MKLHLQDGLGSVRAVADDSAALTQTLDFSPYGVPQGSYGTGFGFTGEYTDANDLLYLRARYYAPEMGVFTALDPMETANRYGYVSGNPVNRVDPTGLFDWPSLRTQPGDCIYGIARDMGITPEDNPQGVAQFIARFKQVNSYPNPTLFITQSSECPGGSSGCPNPNNPWLKPNVQVQIPEEYFWSNGQFQGPAVQAYNGVYGRNRDCGQTTITVTPSSTATSTSTSTPTTTPTYTSTPTATCTATPLPTFTPSLQPSPTEEPRVTLMVGIRADLSTTLAGIGQDINVELQVYPENLWPTNWFREPFVGIAYTTARPVSGAEISSSGSGINTSVGAIIGLVNTPEHGQVSQTFTAGGGIDPATFFLAPIPLSLGAEGDVTVSGSDVIAFVGVGRAFDTNVLPYSGFVDVNGTSTFIDPGQWLVETVRGIVP